MAKTMYDVIRADLAQHSFHDPISGGVYSAENIFLLDQEVKARFQNGWPISLPLNYCLKHCEVKEGTVTSKTMYDIIRNSLATNQFSDSIARGVYVGENVFLLDKEVKALFSNGFPISLPLDFCLKHEVASKRK